MRESQRRVIHSLHGEPAFKLTGRLKELAEKAPFTALSLGVLTILSVFGGRNYSHPESNNETRKEPKL